MGSGKVGDKGREGKMMASYSGIRCFEGSEVFAMWM
jgi:hypothetical protein